MRRIKMLGLCLALVLPVHAQTAQPSTAATAQAAPVKRDVPVDDIRTEDTVIVTGDQPGPGLWLVRKGAHDLWILGTLSPLPAKMQWQSTQVDTVIGKSQEVLQEPRVRVDFKNTGFFKSLFLLPSLLGARKNPDGKTLQQLVPAQAYERWVLLKARYIGRDTGIEQWRPIFAAQELYDKAIRKSGLDTRNQVKDVVAASINKYHPNVTPVELKIELENPKALIREFGKSELQDTVCFEKTMRRIENDLDAMRERANAWATGDTEALQALPFADQYEACKSAISDSAVGNRMGFKDAEQQLKRKWLAAADAALDKNTVTFATLSLRDMLGTNGYLAQLKARGYMVLAPDE